MDINFDPTIYVEVTAEEYRILFDAFYPGGPIAHIQELNIDTNRLLDILGILDEDPNHFENPQELEKLLREILAFDCDHTDEFSNSKIVITEKSQHG